MAASSQGVQTSTIQPRPKRRWLRRIVIAGGVLLLLVLLLVLLLPTLVSTGPGRRYVLSFVNGSIPGKLNAQSLSVGWFSSTHIKGLQLNDASGKSIVSADEVSTQATALGLAQGGLDLGAVKIVNLKADIEQDAQGNLNVVKAVQAQAQAPAQTPAANTPSSPSSSPSLLEKLKLKFELVNADITYRAPGIDPVQVNNLHITTDVPTLSDLKATVSADITQAGDKGRIDLNAAAKDLFSPSAALTLDKAQIDTTGTIKGLPIGAVDRLAKQSGRLVALLGPSLDADLSVKGDMANFTGKVNARSQHLTVDAKVQGKDNQLTADPDTLVKLHVTPDAGNAFLSGSGDNKEPVRLLDPVDVELRVTSGGVKLNKTQVATDSVKLESNWSISNARIDAPGGVGQVRLTNTHGQISLDGSNDGKATVTVLSSASLAGGEGGIDVTATANKLLGDKAQPTYTVDATLKRWPTATVDALLQQAGLVRDSIGPVLDASAHAMLASNDEGELSTGKVTLTAKSDRMDTRLVGDIDKGFFNLDTKNSRLSATLVPQLVKRFAPKEGAASEINLLEPVQANVTFDRLSLPLAMEKIGETSLAMTLTTSPISADLGKALGQAQARNVKLTLTTAPVKQSVDATLDLSLVRNNAQSPLTVKAHATEIISKDGKLNAGGAVTALDVSSTRFDPAMFVPSDQPLPALENVKLVVKPWKQGGRLDATLDAVAVSDRQRGPINVTVASPDPLAKNLEATVKATLTDLPVLLADRLAKMDGKLLAALGDKLDRVELTVVRNTGKPDSLTALAKSSCVDVDVAGSLEASSGLVNLRDQSHVQLDLTPQLVNALYPPGKAPIQLTRGGTVRLDLDRASIAVPKLAANAPKDAQALDLSRSSVKATVAAPQLTFVDTKTRQPIEVKDLKLALDAANPRKQVVVDLSGTVRAGEAQSNTPPAPIRSHTTVSGLFDSQGKLDPAQLAFTTDTKLSQVHTALVALAVSQLDPRYTQALGPTVSLDVAGTYPGNLDIKVDSKNVKLHAPLVIDNQRTVTLKEHLTGQMEINSETAQLLGSLSPVLSDASGAPKPATLFMDKNSFRLPLGQKFDLSKVRVEGRVELNTLTLNQSWLVKEYAGGLGSTLEGLGKITGGVGAVLQIVGQATNSSDVMKVTSTLDKSINTLNQWSAGKADYTLTPAIFSLENGKLHTQDMWVIKDDLRLGIQGDVDLVGNQIDMKLGIPARTLVAQVPLLSAIKGFSPTQVFSLPIKGTIGQAQVERKQRDKLFGEVMVKSLLGRLGQLAGDLLGQRDNLFGSEFTPAKVTWDHMPPWPNEQAAPTETEKAQSAEQAQQAQEQPKPEENKNDRGVKPGQLLDNLLQNILPPKERKSSDE
ncbi:MAG: hypothetical protein GC164_04335 [Phycisphaera sp.]|nr:hypothetical protein [Phycisphaera sp.]